jgi:outer membrane receptor protein involved in Fe transport
VRGRALDQYALSNWHYGTPDRCGSLPCRLARPATVISIPTYFSGEKKTMSRKFTYSRTPVAAAIGGILAAGSPVVMAQSTDDGLIEEIIVTATRREASVQDIPYNITAVGGERLADAQIVDNMELMREVAGAAVVDRGYRNVGVINGVMIRGLNVDSSAFGDYALNTVPTVSTYVNETPIYASFMLKDVDRIEVLRGPQGTLYGSGSLGGTVRYIMNAPDTSRFEGSFSGWGSQTDGSEGTNFGGDLVLNAPISEKAAVRLLAGTIQADGIIDLPNVYVLDGNGIPVAPNGVLDDEAVYERVEDADDVDIKYARVSLYVAPSENFNFTLAHQTQSDDIGGRRHRTNGPDGFGDAYGKYELGSIQREPSSRDVNLTSLEAEVDLGFATLTSSTSVYDHEGDSTSENTGFYAQLNWLEFYYYNYPRPMASAVRTYSDEAFIQELRLVSNGDGGVDWVVGAFYRDQDLNSTQDSYLRGFEAWADTAFGDDTLVVTDRDFSYERDENFTDLGIFGEVTYHISDTFRVTGGLRYFDNEFTNNTYMAVGLWAPGIFFLEDTATFKESEDDVLFKVNASWDISDESMVYATISEGYRRGGSNAVPLSGPFAEDPGWLQYSSDSVMNYEIGIKGTTERFRYSAAAFFVDWDDVQLNTASSNWAFFTAANGDSAETSGLEFEIDGFLTEQLRYNVGYAYVNAELTADAYAPTEATRLLASDGATLPGTAEHTISAALQYSMELGNGLDWTTRIGGYYQSDTQNALGDFGRAPGTFLRELDAFTLWNLSTWVSGEQWRATLFVKNLGNEDGITGHFSELYMGTSPEQNYYGNGSKEFLTLPRTVGVTFTWDF